MRGRNFGGEAVSNEVRLRNPQNPTGGGAEVDPQEGKHGHRRRRRKMSA